MQPMSVAFAAAIMVLIAGSLLRGQVSRRLDAKRGGRVTSAQVAALNIPVTMTVLLVGPWATVFLDPADEFVQLLGAIIGIGALLNYAGCRSHGWHHRYMARTMHRVMRMYSRRTGETVEDYSRALRSTGRAYLVVAGLALIQTVMAVI